MQKTVTEFPSLQQQVDAFALLAVGLDHQTASEDLRVDLAVSPHQVEEALLALKDSLSNGVILSTGNRTELYFQSSSVEEGVSSAVEFLSSYSGMDPEQVLSHLYIYEAQDAFQHLIDVASGRDSQAPGETGILGQMQEALQASNRLGLCLGPLERVFHTALKAGERARIQTLISRNAGFVSDTAVELAKTVFSDLHGLRGLVIGIGDAGRSAAQALKDEGLQELLIVNRTFGKATQVAAEIGGVPVPIGRIGSVIGGVDVVIAATSGATYVLSPEMIEEARRSAHGPMVIIDIAEPNAVDPEVGLLPGVTLYSTSDIEAAAIAEMGTQEAETAVVSH